MAEHPCFSKLVKAFPKMGKREARNILRELEKERQIARAKNQMLHDALQNRGDKIMENFEVQQDLRKFRFYRNLEHKKREVIKLSGWKKFKNGFFRGVQSMIDGTEFAKEGAHDSISLKQLANQVPMFNSYVTDLMNEDLMDIANGKDHQVDLHDALIGMHVDNKRIRRTAEIMNKYLSEKNRRLEREGIYIDPLAQRGVQHFHLNKELNKWWDTEEGFKKTALLSSAEKFEKSFQRWKSFIYSGRLDTLLDRKKTERNGIPLMKMSEKEIEDFLRESFLSITNNRKFTDVGKSMSMRLESRRVLHFKDSKSFVKYNKKFGVGTIGENVKRELEGAARNLAVIQTLGDRPMVMLRRIMKEAVNQNPEFKFDFNQDKKKQKLENLLDETMGSFNDSSSNAARIMANIRSFNNLTNLGSVIFAAITDLAPISQTFAHITGSWTKGIALGLKTIMSRSTRLENKEIASFLKIWTQVDMGGATRFFSSPDASANLMNKAQRLQWKLSGMRWWDESHRASVAAMAAKSLADHREFSFKDMENTQAGRNTILSMKQLGVDSDLWDLIRSTPVEDLHGNKFITSDGIKNVPDDVIKDYLRKTGALRVTQTAINDLKDEVQQKMNMYYYERVNSAILNPSAADKQFWFRGTKAGTVPGEVARSVGQYKQYSTAFISTPIAKMLYGKGAESWQEALLQGKGDIQGLSMLVGYATVLGYMGLVSESLAKNETPPSPFSEEAIRRSIINGGGLGPATQFIFSDPNAYGGGILNQLEGPTLSKGSQAFSALIGAFNGSTNKSQLIRLMKNNTPFAKLFYTRGAFNYLLFNRLQELANPGYNQHKLSQLHQNHQNQLISTN